MAARSLRRKWCITPSVPIANEVLRPTSRGHLGKEVIAQLEAEREAGLIRMNGMVDAATSAGPALRWQGVDRSEIDPASGIEALLSSFKS